MLFCCRIKYISHIIGDIISNCSDARKLLTKCISHRFYFSFTSFRCFGNKKSLNGFRLWRLNIFFLVRAVTLRFAAIRCANGLTIIHYYRQVKYIGCFCLFHPHQCLVKSMAVSLRGFPWCEAMLRRVYLLFRLFGILDIKNKDDSFLSTL